MLRIPWPARNQMMRQTTTKVRRRQSKLTGHVLCGAMLEYTVTREKAKEIKGEIERENDG